MMPSRAKTDSTPEETTRDTIPAPPPSPSSSSVEGDDAPVESRVASRRRDTVPAPASESLFDADEEPATDPAPAHVDAAT